MNTNTAPQQTQTTKCPICGKESNVQYMPFCSKHCADVDLNRWLSGVYRIETDESPETLPVEES